MDSPLPTSFTPVYRSAPRSTGRFYTGEGLREHLQTAVLRLLESEPGRSLEICDPFAGDGRLVDWVVAAMALRADLPDVAGVELWDTDVSDLDKFGCADAAPPAFVREVTVSCMRSTAI